MTVLVVAALGAAGMIILASVLHAVVRRNGRERDRLINQICHLAGKPWQPAPASEPEPIEGDGYDPDRYLVAPEQLPDL